MDIGAAVREALGNIPSSHDRENFAIHLEVLRQIGSDRFREGEVEPTQKLKEAGLLVPVPLGRDWYRASDEFATWLSERTFSVQTQAFELKR